METNLDASVGPAGEKAGPTFGYLLLTLGPARLYRGSLLITLMELTTKIARPMGRDVSDVWEKTSSLFIFLYMGEWLQDARIGISSVCPQFLITDLYLGS